MVALPDDRPLVCMVTAASPSAPGEALRRITEAACAGVHLVQIRDRDLSDRDLYGFARAAILAVRGTATRILVNDRPDVAIAAGAGGVHLREDAYDASSVRRITPPGFLVGRSVHSLDGALRAEAGGGIDYLIFGTVFSSRSKAGRAPAGSGALRDVVHAVRVPVLAIGGVAPETMDAVARAGAAGFAAIELFERAAGTIESVVDCARRTFDSFRPVV